MDDYLASTPKSFRLAELEVVRAWALDDLGQRRPATVEEASFPLVAGAVLEGRAVWLLGDPATVTTAEDLFLAAAERWRGRLLTSELRCLWGAGEAARRGEAHDRARSRLIQVEEVAERHGLVPLLARIPQITPRGGRVGPGPPGATGWRAHCTRTGSAFTRWPRCDQPRGERSTRRVQLNGRLARAIGDAKARSQHACPGCRGVGVADRGWR